MRYPYARGVLVEMYREAKARLGDPVLAWADVVGDPERRRRYQQARGKGGLVRVSWDEAVEIAAAAHVHTIKTYGPDRCAGFSPIPAMSMVSHCVGTRFIQLIGGVMTSFYDWYADLPVASPQVFGDQTDVPGVGGLVGRHVPDDVGLQRPGDPHARRALDGRGALPRHQGGHGQPGLRGQHQVRRRVAPRAGRHRRRAGDGDGPRHPAGSTSSTGEVPFFPDYVRQYTDLPFLVTLDRARRRRPSSRRSSSPPPTSRRERRRPRARRGRPSLLDEATGEPVVPNGSMGFRYTESRRGQVEPRPRGRHARPVAREVAGGRGRRGAAAVLRGRRTGRAACCGAACPSGASGGHLVTTVFDLMLAQYGVGRDGLPGEWPTGYDDAATPYTPGLAGGDHLRPGAGRASASPASSPRNAEQSSGRSMIIMGAGICQWFHGDATYRAILALLMLTGCMGRNGGGWAHYVGQEKCRPITGWISLANALDWSRPPRTMIGTAYWYMHTDQWRFDGYSRGRAGLPARRGTPGRHAHRGHHRAVRAAGLDAVLPAVRPQPAGPRGRGRGRGRRRRRADPPTTSSTR